jgi:hypothetical protein
MGSMCWRPWCSPGSLPAWSAPPPRSWYVRAATPQTHTCSTVHCTRGPQPDPDV